MKIDLQKFCAGKNDLRFNLRFPFSRGAYTYATNGHIIVRVARRDDVPEVHGAPQPESLFKTKPRIKFVPVPDCTSPDDAACESCHGDGVKKCDMGHDHDCDTCEGRGKVVSREPMKVGPSHYQKQYIALIQGWEIAPEPDMNPAWIRTDGADGLLMPTLV